MDKKNKEIFKDKFEEIYFQSIKDIQKTREYKENHKQINNIRNNLINKYLIDESLIDLLISNVEESTADEYEFANERIINYFG